MSSTNNSLAVINIATIITRDAITVNYNGETHMVRVGDPAFEQVKLALREGRKQEIPVLISREKALQQVSNGAFVVKDGQIWIDGKTVRGDLGARIMEFHAEGLPFEPLVEFTRKVRLNPSFRAVEDLFSFLELNKHPITEDGNFIAYKRVHAMDKNGRYLDIHSKTMDNAPGKVLSMPRNEVDEDPNRTCSAGLHVANWNYAANIYAGSTGVMLEVAVSPSDVVAIPVDYNQAKMRVCKYTVLGEVVNPNDNKLLVRNLNQEQEEDSEISSEEEENLEEESNSEEGDEVCCEGCGCIPEDCYCDEDAVGESEEEEKEEESDSNRPGFNAILPDDSEPVI